MSQRYRGKVRLFHRNRGWGFIEIPGEDDVFVHYSEIQQSEGYRSLEEGELVEFEIKRGDRGPIAIKVLRLNN